MSTTGLPRIRWFAAAVVARVIDGLRERSFGFVTLHSVHGPARRGVDHA